MRIGISIALLSGIFIIASNSYAGELVRYEHDQYVSDEHYMPSHVRKIQEEPEQDTDIQYKRYMKRKNATKNFLGRIKNAIENAVDVAFEPASSQPTTTAQTTAPAKNSSMMRDHG